MNHNKSNKNWVILLFSTYLFLWCYLAIKPINRFNWLLENGLILLFLTAILFLYDRIPLSNISYTWMTVFLLLHTIGAHYSYHTPLDTWLHLKRAYYDRLVHFSFGFCFVYPIYESLRFFYQLTYPIAIIFANIFLLAASAMYEIFEVWVVCLVAPSAGALFLGLQGDQWDAQHDMEIAMIGALSASILMFIWKWYRKKTTDPF